MHIGYFGQSTTMTFVIPGTDIPTVTTNISMIAGDGDPYNETFTVDIFNLIGDTLFSQTYTTFIDGASIQFAGEAASIRLRLEDYSYSGAVFDDISFDISSYPVPEPSTFFLILCLFGIIGTRKELAEYKA